MLLRCDENIKCCYAWAVENTAFGIWAKKFNKRNGQNCFGIHLGQMGRKYLN